MHLDADDWDDQECIVHNEMTGKVHTGDVGRPRSGRTLMGRSPEEQQHTREEVRQPAPCFTRTGRTNQPLQIAVC